VTQLLLSVSGKAGIGREHADRVKRIVAEADMVSEQFLSALSA
jgi:hypothetical protein